MKNHLTLLLYLFSLFFLFSSCTFPEGSSYLNNTDRDRSIDSAEYEPAERSRRGGRSRRRSSSSSGGSSSSSSNLSPTIDEINRLEELEVEDYLDSVVYFYNLIGVCDSSTTASTHESCVLNCIRTESNNLLSCLSTCNSDNSCSVEGSDASGVFESSSTVLTNHHVVEEAVGPYTENGEYYYHIVTSIESHSGDKALLDSVRWYNVNDDVALVELSMSLSGSDAPSFGSLSSLRLLDELFTIGNPDGVKWTASLGHLTNKNPPLEVCDNCILYSIPTGGGNSGGPVFNSEGRLVAIHAFVLLQDAYARYDNMRGGPHIDRIKELIQENRSGNQRQTVVLNRIERKLARSDQRELAEIVKDIVVDLRRN